MDLAATQIYEDEDFSFAQKISHTDKKRGLMQIGTLNIDSTEYQIKEGITKIGRHNDCDIVLKDVTVSKMHAEIEASGDQDSTWICDLNSSNTTKLNNLTLRPNRSYELKDGSTITFGKVNATYHIYRPADDLMIPETPAPQQQKVGGTIIPSTPDSSLNSSSVMDNDGSIIFGTQKENNVFRRPQVRQHQSTTPIDKQNTSRNSSIDGSDNKQITELLLCKSDITKNRENNIFAMETQRKEQETMQSDFVHDLKTQTFSADASKQLAETNVEIDKQLLNNQDRTDRSATDIYDMETQNLIDINELETQNSETSIRDIMTKKFITNIHDAETQKYISNNDKDSIQKFKMDKNISRKADLYPVERNIHDLETQKLDNKCITGNISDLETQFDGVTNTAKDIFNAETQLEMTSMANETTNVQAIKDKDDIANIATKNRTDYENSMKSRSTTPGSLHLSSPGIDEEDCLSLASNQSNDLLESSVLLHYFSDNIDKNIMPSNASTPKAKTSLKKDDIGNVSNTSEDEDNDEDIFNAPTQCIRRKSEDLLSDNSEVDKETAIIMQKISKKKHGKSQAKKIDDDSETDAEEHLEEVAKQQRESSGASNKSCNGNVADKNDPATSVESEDIFDILTQQLDNYTTNDTSNNVRDTHDQDNQANISVDINNSANQIILSRETSPKPMISSKDSSSKNNQNDIDDTALSAAQVINTNLDQDLDRSKSSDCNMSQNLDCEDIAYETAPTQVLGEIENEKNRNFNREKASPVKLNDTIEEKLNKMFDDVNNDSIHEPPQMSTQYLEDILESSQCDNNLSINKSIIDNRDTCNVYKKQLEKNKATCDQFPNNTPITEIVMGNVNKAKTESQNSDVYFSTLTTRRKRNILKDTQELVIPIVDVLLSHRDGNFSPISKANDEKTLDDNTVTRFKRKTIPKSETKSNIILTDNLNDDNVNKTISGKKKNTDSRNPKSSEQKDKIPEMNERALDRRLDKVKVDDAEGENITSDSNACIPCPSDSGQRVQISNVLYESDDDILIRLPAVRISGTLSNPGSPSASSTSTIRNARSKAVVTRGKKRSKKSVSSKKRSVRKQGGNFKKDEKLNEASDDHSNINCETLQTDETSDYMDTSEDSDNETRYKRFKQIANRILNDESDSPKRQTKSNVQNNKITMSNISSLLKPSKELKQSTNIGAKSLKQISSRTTRSSRRQNDESSRVIQEEAHLENNDRSINLQMSAVTNKKINLGTTKENKKQINLKKCKTALVIEERPILTRGRRNTTKVVINKQSLDNPECITKTTSRGNSPIIEEIKSFENKKTRSKTRNFEETKKSSVILKKNKKIDSGKSHLRNVTIGERSNETEQFQTEEKEIQICQLQDGKVLKILLSPLKNSAERSLTKSESQEVEMIMRGASCDVDNENLLIRKRSNVKILQRGARTRRRERVNANIETALTESSMSSDINDSDNAQSDNSVSKAKRRKVAASFVAKKETFKKPTRTNKNSTRSIESFAENSIRKDNEESMESDVSSSSRISRSKAANIKRKMDVNQDRIKSPSKMNVSMESTSLASTPSSRIRRSMSVMSNSSPSAARQKILFTGITEDYSKILKTLGGIKVENPASCTVLVTDKVRRTYKFLCALAKGLPIVAIDWLRDSESAAQFLDWQGYILKDPVAEAKFGFRLRKSLDKAKEKRLLDGYTIVLTPNVAPPPTEELKNMVTSCGGKVLLRPPAKWPERAVIISREENLQNAKKFLAKAPKTVTIQSTEFILTGILRQEIDFDKYKLT